MYKKNYFLNLMFFTIFTVGTLFFVSCEKEVIVEKTNETNYNTNDNSNNQSNGSNSIDVSKIVNENVSVNVKYEYYTFVIELYTYLCETGKPFAGRNDIKYGIEWSYSYRSDYSYYYIFDMNNSFMKVTQVSSNKYSVIVPIFTFDNDDDKTVTLNFFSFQYRDLKHKEKNESLSTEEKDVLKYLESKLSPYKDEVKAYRGKVYVEIDGKKYYVKSFQASDSYQDDNNNQNENGDNENTGGNGNNDNQGDGGNDNNQGGGGNDDNQGGNTSQENTSISYTINGRTFKTILVEGDNISPFYIMQTEIPYHGYMMIGDDYIDLDGIDQNSDGVIIKTCFRTFLDLVIKATGLPFRLPTTKEWEYAARGGKYDNGYIYSGSNSIDDVAWYKSNSENASHEIATKAPNELGLYDMSGNYAELCNDTKDKYNIDDSFCGGSWKDTATDCKVSSKKNGSTVGNIIGRNGAVAEKNAYDASFVGLRLVYSKE